MKKIFIVFLFINILTSNSISAELDDCTVYKKLSSKYLKCKSGNFIKETKNYQTTKWSAERSKLDKIIKKDEI